MTRNTFSRRRFLQLSGGLALAGVSLPLWAHDMADMAGGDAHPALRLPEPYKIKLAINKSAVCLAPVAVAEQQKIFSKYNLDVEFVNFGNSTDVLLEAIATGKADAGVGMALRWLKALEQGFDVKLTAGTHGGCLNLLTAKDSPFGGLESLKGQTIGVTDMAGPDKNFFAILLKRHGIDPISDVQWKVYPADLLSVALDKREIAAISGSEPFSYRLLETGKYQLIASNMTGDYANLSCCVLGVSGSLARDHKPAAAALTQAILEAHSYAAAHPESVAQSFLAHALNTSEAEVSGILHGQGHGHHAVGEAFVKELTQYAVDLQRAGDQTGYRSPSVRGEYLCQRIRLSRLWRAPPAARRCGEKGCWPPRCGCWAVCLPWPGPMPGGAGHLAKGGRWRNSPSAADYCCWR